MIKRMATALLACVATAVVADWHAVFGARTMQRADFVHLTFTPVDERAQSPIADVHIACTRPMSRSACTERQGRYPGELEITLGVLRITRKTLLFEHDEGISLGRAGAITLTFIHPNYIRHTLTLDVEAIAAGPQAQRVVKLSRAAD